MTGFTVHINPFSHPPFSTPAAKNLTAPENNAILKNVIYQKIHNATT